MTDNGRRGTPTHSNKSPEQLRWPKKNSVCSLHVTSQINIQAIYTVKELLAYRYMLALNFLWVSGALKISKTLITYLSHDCSPLLTILASCADIQTCRLSFVLAILAVPYSQYEWLLSFNLHQPPDKNCTVSWNHTKYTKSQKLFIWEGGWVIFCLLQSTWRSLIEISATRGLAFLHSIHTTQVLKGVYAKYVVPLALELKPFIM